MDLEIHPLSRADLKAVVRLLKNNLSPFEPAESEHDAIWSRYSAQGNVFSVVAKLGAEVVGYGTVVIETKIRGGKLAHIEDIVSASEYRRSGIGSRILVALLEVVETHRCYKAVLACAENNREFYLANGYKQDGIAMTRFFTDAD